jgi:hypothetical protein
MKENSFFKIKGLSPLKIKNKTSGPMASHNKSFDTKHTPCKLPLDSPFNATSAAKHLEHG